MDLQDLFVGSVAIALGSTAIAAAAINWEGAFRLRTARRIEKQFGRPTARWFYAGLGVALIALGLLIMSGFGPNRGQGGTDVRPSTGSGD